MMRKGMMTKTNFLLLFDALASQREFRQIVTLEKTEFQKSVPCKTVWSEGEHLIRKRTKNSYLLGTNALVSDFWIRRHVRISRMWSDPFSRRNRRTPTDKRIVCELCRATWTSCWKRPTRTAPMEQQAFSRFHLTLVSRWRTIALCSRRAASKWPRMSRRQR